MAVAFDAKTATVTDVSGVSTLTISNLTVGAALSNGAMAVLIEWVNASLPAGITVVWDNGGTNQSMTAIPGASTASGANSVAVAAYGLLAPTAGNKNLVISWTGNLEAHAVAISFSGVDQTSVAVAFPHGAFILKTVSTAGPVSVTITSAIGNMVVAGFEQDAAVWGTIDPTVLASSTVGPSHGVAFDYTNGANSVTLNAAFSGTAAWTAWGFDVLAAGGGVAASPTLGILGLASSEW